MAFYNEKRSASFDVHDFLEMRARPEAYLVFYKHFIKCVTKKTVYESNIQRAKTYDDVCSVSDEALALLLLENSWDRWMDLHQQDPNALLPKRGRQQQGLTSKIPTKYTKGGYKYENDEDTSTTGNRKGWSREGITRYNELFELVAADRAAHPDFLRLFLDDVRGEHKKTIDKREEPLKAPPVIAHHNLFKNENTTTTSYTTSSQNGSSYQAQPRKTLFGVSDNYENDSDDNATNDGVGPTAEV